ncbi:hypothetical protein O3G_MSEX008427 [Manduca sexta]|uniref:Uncharacterized protein n=1 Tax=Manduca sexta TaxID=7130 RepID=A0A921Z9Q6_MANSE|nr:hypothetical protein O3G_MSEX008427 [Manduca sexta]
MEPTTAKVISMLALGFGSFFSGVVPACFSEGARQRHPLLLSCLLCFGGGVLLSTSLVHMMPEAREKLPKYTELMVCIGFFIVYFVDELVHLFHGERQVHEEIQRYGSVEDTALLVRNAEIRERCAGDVGDSRMCHVSHTEPCSKSSSGIIGLLVALFVHSLLEGLAIGLQESSTKVFLLLSAVASHKFVVGFCLGAELCASLPQRLCAHIVCITLFSAGSVAGIAAGAGLETIDTLKNSIAVPIMQVRINGSRRSCY